MIPSYMLPLPPADFRFFSLRITRDKWSAIATPIEQPTQSRFAAIKNSLAPVRTGAQIKDSRTVIARRTPPRRNYHGITSLCMSHRITSIDSHPCKISGGVGSSTNCRKCYRPHIEIRNLSKNRLRPPQVHGARCLNEWAQACFNQRLQ